MSLTKATYSMIKGAPFYVVDYGATGDGTDQRANIQSCLDAAGVNADIYFESGVNYRISPIGNPSGTGSEATYGGLRPLAGQTLYLNGCTLTALSPGINNASCVVNVYGVNNVTIKGPGTIIGDRNIGSVGRTGEFGQCVSLRGGNNLVVRDCSLKSAWGDGILVATTQDGTDYPVGVLIDNCEFDDISRNGISIVSARNVVISNNRCKRVNRTAPKSFIDFEPDPPSFAPNRDCVVYGNTCIPDANGVAQVDVGLFIVGANSRVIVSSNSFYGLYASLGIGDSSKDIRVFGNILRAGDLGQAGNLWLTATTPSTINGVYITGNDIIGGLTHSISFISTTYSDVNISNNRILVNQTGARLAVFNNSSETIFQNNEVFFTGDALDGFAFFGDFTGTIMGGNRFNNSTGNTSQSFNPNPVEVTPDYYGTGLTRYSNNLQGYGAQVGFQTGVGGTVTQATSKSTAVTLNKPCGTITMDAATLGATTSVGFTLNNSVIGADDVVVVSIKSGATANSYVVSVDAVAAGSCRISLRNVTSGSLSEAVVLSFAVIKAVAA